MATLNKLFVFLVVGVLSLSTHAEPPARSTDGAEVQAMNQSLSLRLTHLFFRTIFQEYMREGLAEKRPNFLVHRYYIETFLAEWDQELETESSGSTLEIWQKIIEKKRGEYLGSSYQIWQRSMLYLFERTQPELFKSLEAFQINLGYYRQTFLARVLYTEKEKNLELRILQLLEQVGSTLLTTSEDLELGISMLEPFVRYPDARISIRATELIVKAPKVRNFITGAQFVLGAMGLKSMFSALYRQPGRLSSTLHSGVMQLSKLSGAMRTQAFQKLSKVPRMKELLHPAGSAAENGKALAVSVAMHGGLLVAFWPEKKTELTKPMTPEERDERAVTKFEVLADLALRSQRADGILESSLLQGGLSPLIHSELKRSRAETIKGLEEILHSLKQGEKNRSYNLFPLVISYENALGMLPTEKELFYRLANRRILSLRSRVAQIPDGGFEQLRQLLLSEDLFNYRYYTNDVNSVLTGWGGNCVSQTLVFLSLLREFPKLLPKDRKLKVAIFLDHMELAFEDDNEWQLLVHGKKYLRSASVSVFEPEVLLEEMIRILKTTPEGQVLKSNPLASPQLKIHHTRFTNEPVPEYGQMKYKPLDQISSDEQHQFQQPPPPTKNDSKENSKEDSTGPSSEKGNDKSTESTELAPVSESRLYGEGNSGSGFGAISNQILSGQKTLRSEIRTLNGFLSTEKGRVPVCIAFGGSSAQKCKPLNSQAHAMTLANVVVTWSHGASPQIHFNLSQLTEEQKQKIYSDLTSLPQEFWNLYLTEKLSREYLGTRQGRDQIVNFFEEEMHLEMAENKFTFLSSFLQCLEFMTLGPVVGRSQFQVMGRISESYHPSAAYVAGMKQIQQLLSKKRQAHFDPSSNRLFVLPGLQNVGKLVGVLDEQHKFYRMLRDDALVFLGSVVQAKKLSVPGASLLFAYEEFLKKNPDRVTNEIFIVRQVRKALESLRPVDDKPQMVLKRKEISRYTEKSEKNKATGKDEVDLPEVNCPTAEDCPLFYVIGDEKSSAPKIDPEEKVIIQFDYSELIVFLGLTGRGVYLWDKRVIANLGLMGQYHYLLEPLTDVNIRQRSGLNEDFFAKNPELDQRYKDLQNMIRILGKSHTDFKRIQQDVGKLTREERESIYRESKKIYESQFRHIEKQFQDMSNRFFKF